MRSILAFVLAGFVLPNVHGLEAPAPGYGVVELSWEMEITPGGATVVLNGTIQEAHAQLLQINPNYDVDFAAVAKKREALAAVSTLKKRGHTDCNNYPQCSRGRIREGISYLNGVAGRPSNGPGPGNCGRVSCSYNSAIWWCNDNSGSKTLPGFYSIADGAQEVLNRCDVTSDSVSGQAFYDDNWNVIVRSNGC